MPDAPEQQRLLEIILFERFGWETVVLEPEPTGVGGVALPRDRREPLAKLTPAISLNMETGWIP